MCKKNPPHAAVIATPSQPPPSNPPQTPRRPRWSYEDCIRNFVIFPLAIFIIGFVSSDFLSSNSRQQYSAGIVSEVFRFPERFMRDYQRVERDLKVYIYRDRDPGAYFQSPRELTGIYRSEAYFFKNIKESRFLTTDPLKAHLFFIPISWHQMRTQRTPYENMTVIVEKYVKRLISKYPYWNKTEGADHFFVICHKKGARVAEQVPFLRTNPIRLVCPGCPATYDSRYTSYKSIALPHVDLSFNRTKSGFWESIPNSEIIADNQNNPTNTAEGYLLFHSKVHKTKFCVCPLAFPGYSNHIADFIRYGCVPVVGPNYVNFPFYDILDWHKFSIRFTGDVFLLEDTLKGVRAADFTRLRKNLLNVQKHFQWNSPPRRFDAFNMAMFDLWQHLIL